MKLSTKKLGCSALAAAVLGLGYTVPAYSQVPPELIGTWDRGSSTYSEMYQFWEEGTFRHTWITYNPMITSYYVWQGDYDVIGEQIKLDVNQAGNMSEGAILWEPTQSSSTLRFELAFDESMGKYGLWMEGDNLRLWRRDETILPPPPPTPTIPEPETWAMLLAGLGVMGTVARRRKKQA